MFQQKRIAWVIIFFLVCLLFSLSGCGAAAASPANAPVEQAAKSEAVAQAVL